VPVRVPAEVKELVLKTVDDAVAAGFAHIWVCSLWQVSDERVHRWRARRRDTGTLVDRAPGGHPVHALLPGEVAAILDVAERWGEVDRSHRKAGPPRLLREPGVGVAVHLPSGAG
jgi:putative transposase